MFESKFVQAFIKFSLEERRKLRKWIVSDFVNKNEDIVHLFRFIDSRTAINVHTVNKEKTHKYIYPDAEFNDLRIRHLLWMATEILESFILFNCLPSYPSLQEQILAQYYTDKELYKFANQHIEQGIKLIEATQLHNSEYYLNMFQLHSKYFLINSRNNRDKDFNVKEIINTATIFSIIELLKYACIIQSYQKNTEIKIDPFLLDSILKLLPGSAFLELPQVRIYYNIYLVITVENENAFHDFIRDIKKNESLFSHHDLNDLYRLAINFCIKRSNYNQSVYTQKAFELYLYSVEKGYLLMNNEINRFIFTNIVALGIKLKEFNKIEKFMNQYARLIDEPYRQNTIDFNNAKILYSNGQPERALKILLTHEFKDAIWNLNAKYLVLKILFEIKNFELYLAHLKAFKAYIKRRSNIGYHKTYFINISKALAILLDISKRPGKYRNYAFEKETPDLDWFKNALVSLRREHLHASPLVL
ncbi:MAG: hypothetical protein JWN78_2463 [Bacteroidota bacterium]|nr:hypothetical protein [Bacteroidota bacterium]